MRKERRYVGSSRPASKGVVERGWRIVTICSDAKNVVSRPNVRGVREFTRGSTMSCPVGGDGRGPTRKTIS